VHFSSKTDEWATPPDLFAELDREFQFTVDVCADETNAKCALYFDRGQDGLAQRWTGRCWMNPPYGREIGAWMAKAVESVRRGDAELVVALVPSRTDARWWHAYCSQGEIRFLPGRLRFGGASAGAPFPSAVIVFRDINPVTEQGL
jgi:phage N-6-adenine-methyltransferase